LLEGDKLTRITPGFHNDHAKLKHLLWSEAGHIIDTDVDLAGNRLFGNGTGSGYYLLLSGATWIFEHGRPAVIRDLSLSEGLLKLGDLNDLDLNSHKLYPDKTNHPNMYIENDNGKLVLKADDGDYIYYGADDRWRFLVGNNVIFNIGSSSVICLKPVEYRCPDDTLTTMFQLKHATVDASHPSYNFQLLANNKDLNLFTWDGSSTRYLMKFFFDEEKIQFVDNDLDMVYRHIRGTHIKTPFAEWGAELLFAPFNNVLSYANEKWTTSVTPAPDVGTEANMYDRSCTTMARWNTPAGDIVIEIDFGGTYHYWRVIGFYCPWTRYPDNYKIEIYNTNTSAWVTLKEVNDGSNTSDYIYWSGGQSYVGKIKITISGYSNNGHNDYIGIGSIFGSTSALTADSGYVMTTDGNAKMHGDLNLNNYNLDDVASIDGGGNAIIFDDIVQVGRDGTLQKNIYVYSTTAGNFSILGYHNLNFYGSVAGYVQQLGTNNLIFTTKNTSDTTTERMVINYGDTPDIDIKNANLDLNYNNINNIGNGMSLSGQILHSPSNAGLNINADNNIVFDIDNVNGSTARYFRVSHDNGTGTLFTVYESGLVQIPNGNLDLNGNDIKNAVISTTGTATEGAIRWDATNHKLQVYNGSAWETVSSS